jgi:hypothetical protein
VLQSHHRLISVDDHIIEHPRVWQDRLPQRYRDMGPKVVEDDNGSEQWVFEGQVVDSSQITSGLAVSAGLELGERTFETIRYDVMRPGAYDPKARLTDMDTDGVCCGIRRKWSRRSRDVPRAADTQSPFPITLTIWGYLRSTPTDGRLYFPRRIQRSRPCVCTSVAGGSFLPPLRTHPRR